MAYRYLDGQGNEVVLADRRALAHRIQIGDIAASTMFFDEDREEWVRATQHPTYVELVEGASGDGIRPTEIAVGAPSTNSMSFEPFDRAMADATRGDVARPEAESSASLESVRATRTLSVDPGSVASRSRGPQSNPPHISRVGRRKSARRKAARRLAVGAFVPLGTLLVMVLLTGVLTEPRTVGGSTADLGPGEPPVGAVAGLTASGERYATRVAELRGEMGLASSPPAIWLDGGYLAHPGRYPDVLEYWDAFRALVQVLRREDMLLYRSGLESHLRESDLSDAERAKSWLWAVRAYDLRRERRKAVFDEFEGLAAAATDLHMLLLRHGERIVHEPVRRGALSSSPVLEVVTKDEAASDALARGLDRVLERLGRTHGLEPVSTARLTGELLDRLWLTTAPAVRTSVVAVR